MFFYKADGNGQILCFFEDNSVDFVDGWKSTEEKIIRSSSGVLIFEKDLDLQAELQAKLQEIKSSKIAELKTARDTEEISPIEYGGYRWDFDDKAIQRINGAIIALGDEDTITWTTADNEEIVVNQEDLNDIIKASAIRSNALHVKYRELKHQVEQAETEEQIKSIVW